MKSRTDLAYHKLVEHITREIENGRHLATRSFSTVMVQTYWKIGQYIVEFEQKGSEKATYGAGILSRLSRDLSISYGKGFSESNLLYIRKLYLLYPIPETLSQELGWSQYCEILKIDDPLERSFYEKQCATEKWSVRELRRQKSTVLFHRLALNKDKEGILALARDGQHISTPGDLIRDPQVWDFLNIQEPFHLEENELEEKLIAHLLQFLLELGKGFAFVGRQYRVTLDNRHFRVDLVFYHYILKCFVLIDLKRNEASHADVGQMNMYLGYFEEEVNREGDNPPVGIVLAREKDEMVVKYAMKNISSNLFVAKYQLYLPNRETLQRKLEEVLTS